MSLSTLLGLIALILFVLAGLSTIPATPSPSWARIHLIGWGLAFFCAYFLFGGGVLVVTH